MKVLIDLNVMLDFLERREPFFNDAAFVMDAVLYGTVQGVLPAHAITTIHYFLSRGTARARSTETIQWLLDTFEIAACGERLLRDALVVRMPDYEDAVTALTAEQTGYSHIVTRNISDFSGSPVPAVRPADLVELLEKA